MYSKITKFYPPFPTLNDNEKFLYMLQSDNRAVLTWLGKFLYHSFKIRNEFYIRNVLLQSIPGAVRCLVIILVIVVMSFIDGFYVALYDFI